MVSTISATGAQPPSGICGSSIASNSELLSTIRSTSSGSTSDSTVAATTATSGPGTTRTFSGRYFQPSITATTSTPTSAAPVFIDVSRPGSAVMLCHAELCDDPPSNTCTCCRAIVTPMPASIACTTTGATASAARAIRLSPNRICSAPAATTMKQVTRQPNWAIDSATTTVSPAAGPLTCRTEPPRQPTTMPPTTAAMSPAATGAPEASAMPSESGNATRKTTMEAGRSWRTIEASLPRPAAGPPSAGAGDEGGA
ncbi:Uncharacterised protein [Mycobacteroides abscessus subsp. abscessus]|nr:Uncharacterised protein [Mycobacteroides abscessus subsp. abscessus]